jgi:hypothetical protein
MKGWSRSLDLLEAAYRLDGSDAEWMENLVSTTSDVFSTDGVGAGGFFVEGAVNKAHRTAIVDVFNAKLSGAEGYVPTESDVRGFLKLPIDVQEALCFSSTLASTMSTRPWVGADLPSWLAGSGWDPTKTADALGLICHGGPFSRCSSAWAFARSQFSLGARPCSRAESP